MYNLTELTEEQFAMLELMNDRLFEYIPADDYRYYIRESIRLGEEAYEEYKCRDLEQILKEAQVEIIRNEREFEHGLPGYKVWAQVSYGEHEKKIELFMPEIRKKCTVLTQNGIKVQEQWLVTMHLAHEFYHFLEYSCRGSAGEKLKPVKKKKFFRTVEKPLRTASEIAAHSFAVRYMNSDIYPQLTDYLVFLHEGILTQEAFQKKMEQMMNLLCNSRDGGKDVSVG